MAASAVPVPLAEFLAQGHDLADIGGDSGFLPPVPTVSFYLFDERLGPDFAGVRQRRFRVHAGNDVLRVNCTPDGRGGKNFFLVSRSASSELLGLLAQELQTQMGAAA